jgi:hypothetical protein
MGSNLNRENKIIANHGEFLEIDVSTKKYPEAVMLIDRLDWISLKSLGIGRVNTALYGNYVYAQCNLNGKMVRLHKLLILNAKCIDHISRDRLDNRRCNLRVCTHSENNMNRGMRSDNKTGFKGVCCNKQAKKFQASINLNGKQKHLGLFDTAEEASEAYKKASLELHKEFSIYYKGNV